MLLHLPLRLGSSLTVTGTGCPWRGSREGGVGRFGGTWEQVVAGKNERRFDVKGGAVWFRLGHMRSIGQGGPFGQVQRAGVGVGVDVKQLGGRAGGVGERRWAVPTEAGWGRRARGHGFGGGSGGTHTLRCSGVEVMRE